MYDHAHHNPGLPPHCPHSHPLSPLSLDISLLYHGLHSYLLELSSSFSQENSSSNKNGMVLKVGAVW